MVAVTHVPFNQHLLNIYHPTRYHQYFVTWSKFVQIGRNMSNKSEQIWTQWEQQTTLITSNSTFMHALFQPHNVNICQTLSSGIWCFLVWIGYFGLDFVGSGYDYGVSGGDFVDLALSFVIWCGLCWFGVDLRDSDWDLEYRFSWFWLWF